MNKINEENEIFDICGEIILQMKMSQEVWIVYMVHGFTDYQSGWYPEFRNSIGETYAKKDRKILIGEVVWKDGSGTMLESALSQDESNALSKRSIKMNEVDDRRNLGPWYDIFTCSSFGIGAIDWSGWATVSSNTMVVGHALGKLTEFLYGSTSSSNGNLKTFCLGHSAGAHVCGFAGKTRKLDGIIGLDPAGPIFKDNYEDGRLSKEDAKFVQVLHIDAGELGIDKAIGHQDIFVNGGINQPGCWGIVSEAMCSHVPFALNFQLKMFQQISLNDASYAKIKCSTENDAMNPKLESCMQLPGVQAKMGAIFDNISVNDTGIFYLDTTNTEIDSCYLTIGSLEDDAFGINDAAKAGINAWIPRGWQNA